MGMRIINKQPVQSFIMLTMIVFLSATLCGCVCCRIVTKGSSGVTPVPENTRVTNISKPTSNTVTPVPVTATVQVPTIAPAPNVTLEVTPTPRPTPTPEPRSLPTGTIIYNSNAANGNSGHGELAVKNYLGYDAIFIMTRQSTPKVPAFGVYIGRYNNYKIAGIPDGSYILYYMYGTDWDGDAKKFTNLVSSRRFDEILNYTTTYSSDSYTYETYTVTLNPLGGGKAITTYVYDSDFPRL